MNCGHSCAEVFRMFEGYYGPYFTPSVDADGNLTWTNNAGLPDPAPINIKGEPGTGLEISGLVATEADLPATAEDWTCYLVGTEVPYTVYTYNPNSGWMSLGELASGPQGDPGVTFTPTVSPAGVISWTNDGDLPNPEPVNIKGPAYTLTEEDKAEIVADVVDEIPLVDPDAKTAAMTQSVGVDANGKLWTAPGGQGGTTDYDQLSNRPSINGHTLTGNQTAAQLGLATPSDIPTVPTKTSDLTNDSGFVNASGAAAAAPVQSVNNKTGAVVLNAADVGAGTYSKPSGGIPASDLASGVIPTVPTNVSAFTNDAGYLTLATLPIYNGEVGT